MSLKITKIKIIQVIRKKYEAVSFCLNEKSRRIWAASEAQSCGWGGITIVAEATGMDHKTIRKGLKEIKSENKGELDRLRSPGGGRKKLSDKQKKLLQDLEELLEPTTRGDPESPLRWTCKSTYKLAEALKQKGYSICQKTIYNVLKSLDYSLQVNKKTKEAGANHPDRNRQFEHINETVKEFQKDNSPVISVDTKKKESIGNYKNNGKEYCQKGKPIEVNVHDFPDKKLGKVSPYGVYDVSKNEGWVSVGISSDTAAFAVNAIRAWWYKMGKPAYSQSKKLLITADCGGSNGYRVRLWKVELQKLANEINLPIYVCHFPPGTSKWNKIEHRMFSYISKNWRGKPLITRETVVNSIANTKTRTGLEIKAMLDENTYIKGIKITNNELELVNLIKDEFHGEWNYKIMPDKDK